MRRNLDRVRRERDDERGTRRHAVEEVRNLREELESLRAQVAPVAEQAAERQATAAHTRELTRQFQDQFTRTAGSVWDLCSRFKIRGPPPPISYTAAHCLHFFSQFADELSLEVESLEVVLDRKSVV